MVYQLILIQFGVIFEVGNSCSIKEVSILIYKNCEGAIAWMNSPYDCACQEMQAFELV